MLFFLHQKLISTSMLGFVESTGKLLATIRSSAPSTALVAPATTRKKHTKTGLVEKQWVIGAAMMFSMEHLRTVGLFDEQIFLFSEESDLCKRIIQEGYKIYLDTDIYIEHLYRQSSTPSPVGAWCSTGATWSFRSAGSGCG